MLVNRLITLTIVVGVLVNLATAFNKYGTIREEESAAPVRSNSFNRQVAAAVNNQDTGNKLKSKSPSSSGGLIGVSNKEFVYGDDEETASSENKSPAAAAASAKSEDMSEAVVVAAPVAAAAAQAADVLDSENMMLAAAAPQQQQQQQPQHHNVKKSDTYMSDDDDASEDEIEQEVEQEINRMRKQRVDSGFFHKLLSENDLRAFHRQKSLQQELLNQQHNRYDFDYEQMLLSQLLNDDDEDSENSEPTTSTDDYIDEFDTNMNAKELGSASASSLMADRQIQKQQLMDQDNMEDASVSGNTNTPVKKTKFDYKENTLSESEYNKKLKTAKDPFFNTQVLTDGDLQWSDKLVANPVDANSAGIQKQANVHHDGENISAKIDQIRQQNDWLFILVVSGCAIAGVVAIIAAGVCWYSVHRNSKAAVNIEYGVKSAGSVKSTSSGDRRLAQSAQMYHYQHQKQQMIAMEKANNDTKPDNSDGSDGETEEGDYTVYECPGLAPTGEMEVKNPLFKEDFSASSQNLFASPSLNTLPPAYSTLASGSNSSQPQAAAAAAATTANEPQSSSVAAESSKETAKLIQIEPAVPEPPTTTVTVESEATAATTPKQ